MCEKVTCCICVVVYTVEVEFTITAAQSPDEPTSAELYARLTGVDFDSMNDEDVLATTADICDASGCDEGALACFMCRRLSINMIGGFALE